MLFDSLSTLLLIAGFGMLFALLMDGLVMHITALRRLWVLPGHAMAKLAERLEAKLNRAHRKDAALRERGVVVTMVLLGAAAIIGALLHSVLARAGQAGAFLSILLAGWCFGAGHLLYALRQARLLAMQSRGSEALQSLVGPHVPKDALLNDRYAMLRAMLQAAAQSTRDRTMAPLMGFLLFGFAGLFVVRLAALLALRWSHPVRAHDFSASVRSLWQVLGAPASLLAATALATSALVTPGARALPAWRQWWLHAAARDGAVAVLGGAVASQLAGPRIGAPDAAWLGEGAARPEPARLRIAGWLHQGARWQVALFVVCAALSLL